MRTLTLNELAEASRIDVGSGPILEEGTELESAMGEMLPPGLVTLTREIIENSEEEESTEHDLPYDYAPHWIVEDNLDVRPNRPRGDLVAFFHSSFPEYLPSTVIRQTKSDVKDFFISQEVASTYVTESCMAYHIHASKSEESSAPDFPLWEYSARYWTQHLENIPKDEWSAMYKSMAKSILRPGSKIFLAMIRVFNPEEEAINGLGRPLDGYSSLDEFPEPFYYLAFRGHLQLLRTLLEEQDIQINAVKGNLGTALNAACLMGYGHIVQELLDHGAQPWLGNDKYPCALAAAM